MSDQHATTIKPWQAEWDALRAREQVLAAPFADPYGRDHFAYSLAKANDPEHARLLAAFLDARRRSRG